MRANGIVSNWSDSPRHPPYVTVGIGLVCLAILLIYYGVSPVLQQAMIEVGGMHPSRLAQILEQTSDTCAALGRRDPFRSSGPGGDAMDSSVESPYRDDRLQRG